MHPAECNKQKRNKPNATSEKQQAKRRNATSKNALSRGKKHTHWPYAPPSSPPTLPTPPPRLQCKIKPASGFRLQVTGCRPRATYSTDCKATAYRVHAPSYRLVGLQAMSSSRQALSGRQTAGHALRATGGKLQATGNRPQGTSCRPYTNRQGYGPQSKQATCTQQAMPARHDKRQNTSRLSSTPLPYKHKPPYGQQARYGLHLTARRQNT